MRGVLNTQNRTMAALFLRDVYGPMCLIGMEVVLGIL